MEKENLNYLKENIKDNNFLNNNKQNVITEEDSVLDKSHIISLLQDCKKIRPYKLLTDNSNCVSCISAKYNYQENKCSNLLTGSFDSTINYYDISKMNVSSSFKHHNNGVWTINCSYFNNNFASGGSDKEIYLWDLKSAKPFETLKHHNNTIYNLKYSKVNSNFLLSCSRGIIALWDLRYTNQPLVDLNNREDNFVYSSNLIINDKYIVYGLIDGSINIARANDGKEVCSYKYEFGPYKSYLNIDVNNSIYSINDFDFTGDLKNNNKFMTSHSDGQVRIFEFNEDLQDLKELKKFNYNWMPCTNAVQSMSNKYVMSNNKDHYSYIWRSNSYDIIDYQLGGHSDMVYCGLFINDNIAITGSADQKVGFWKLD